MHSLATHLLDYMLYETLYVKIQSLIWNLDSTLFLLYIQTYISSYLAFTSIITTYLFT